MQQDPTVGSIRNALTKRCLTMIEKLSNSEPEKYGTFWKEFGAVVKEGLAEDPSNSEKIAGLMRFNSTISEGLDQDRSLDAYLDAL